MSMKLLIKQIIKEELSLFITPKKVSEIKGTTWAKILNHLGEWECFSSVAYDDHYFNGCDNIKAFDHTKYREDEYGNQSPGGTLTIGYGHTQDVEEGDTMTKPEALKHLKTFLKTDPSGADAITDIMGKWSSEGNESITNITEDMFVSMVSLAYNAGRAPVWNSDWIQDVKKGNFNDASKEIKSWRTDSGGKPTEGLVNRRGDESQAFDI
jgi:GH24 family phage-related lysozyme (muramidase)